MGSEMRGRVMTDFAFHYYTFNDEHGKKYIENLIK